MNQTKLGDISNRKSTSNIQDGVEGRQIQVPDVLPQFRFPLNHISRFDESVVYLKPLRPGKTKVLADEHVDLFFMFFCALGTKL